MKFACVLLAKAQELKATGRDAGVRIIQILEN